MSSTTIALSVATLQLDLGYGSGRRRKDLRENVEGVEWNKENKSLDDEAKELTVIPHFISSHMIILHLTMTANLILRAFKPTAQPVFLIQECTWFYCILLS